MFFTKNLSNIDHCFFSRLGGVSQGKYKSLNCGKGSKDENGAIEENLLAISKYYGLKKSDVITMHQTHSSNAIVLDSSNKSEILKLKKVIWAITEKNPLNKSSTNILERIHQCKKFTKSHKFIEIKFFEKMIKSNKTIDLINFLKKNSKFEIYFLNFN